MRLQQVFLFVLFGFVGFGLEVWEIQSVTYCYELL